MPLLPPLSFDSEITANDGREDKIELSLGNWTLRASRDEIEEVQEFMSVPIRNARQSALEAGNYGYLFTRPQSRHGGFVKMKVRKRALESAAHMAHSGRLLFGGKWDLLRAPTSSPGRREYVTALRLSLNPLRFVRHQPIPTRMDSPRFWPRARITASEQPVGAMGEFSLDGEDNWLPHTRSFRSFASSARWPHQLRRYVRTVGDAMDMELRRVTEARDVAMRFSEHFHLRKVETAFEFAVLEPTEFLRSYLHLFSAYRADDSSVREYPAPEIMRVENSLSFKTTIRQGVSLRVYAKTNRRLRFEIIHEKINHRELLGEAPQARGTLAVERPWEQITECLHALREKAAGEMNDLFAYLRHSSRVPASPITPLALLVRIASVLRDYELTHTVASLLCEGGAAVPTKDTPEICNALRALKEAGILRFDGKRRGYFVTKQYRQALSLLSGSDSLRLLITAKPRRQR